MTWYVVHAWLDAINQPDDIDPENTVWTVSRDPKEPGWDTDVGCSGYALDKATAQFLCDAANEKEGRRE